MFRSLAGRIAAQMQRLNNFLAMTPGFAYLQIQYQSALTGKNEPFPAGTVVKVDYVDEAGEKSEHAAPLAIEGDAGKIKFEMSVRYKLSFWLDFSARPYFNVTDNTLMTRQEFDQACTADSLYLTKKAVMLLPDRIDLKNCPWEIDSDLFNDAADQRCFEQLDTKELKGDSEFLPVAVKPEWTFISLRFHDQVSGDEANVPQGLWLKGINEAVSDDVPVAGSSLFKDKNILVPWFLTRDQSTARVAHETVLQFQTQNLFIQDGKFVEMVPDDVWQKPLMERLKYFDLPEEFDSDNWHVKLGSAWEYCHGVINDKTAADDPMIFYLDGVVLTDGHLKSIDWDEDDRFAAMDMRLQVIKPDPDRPFWTTGTTFSNFIGPEHVDKPVRLVACNGEFYDVTHYRCETGKAIGARAAVLSALDVHAEEALLEPLVDDAGNLEVHFLTECLDADNKEMCYLMMYWSAKIEPDPGTDVEPVFVDGFSNARIRWELKQYTFQPQKDPNDKKITVTPAFYFEGRESDPALCKILLHPSNAGRANMGLHVANFREGNEAPSGDSVSEDGVTYTWFTMAHELGHAVGLEDEYAEPIEDSWNPVLPEYKQYCPGMPYSSDLASMMNSNQAPRLRHFWHLCQWLNTNADVKNLTGNTVFHVKSGRGPTYKYYLKPGADNYLKPRYKEEGFTNGAFGKMDLFLYQLGEDETTAKLLPGQTGLKGILVVAPKLAFRFLRKPPAEWADKDEKVSYMKQFQNHINGLNQTIYLHSTDDDEFEKIYVHFMPHYHYLASADAHVTYVILRHEPTEPEEVPDFYADGFTGAEVKVDEAQNHNSMLRYVLGLTPYTEVPTPDGKGKVKEAEPGMKLDEMAFLAEWVKGKRSHDFTVKA